MKASVKEKNNTVLLQKYGIDFIVKFCKDNVIFAISAFESCLSDSLFIEFQIMKVFKASSATIFSSPVGKCRELLLLLLKWALASHFSFMTKFFYVMSKAL